jgi:hypothetical protein
LDNKINLLGGIENILPLCEILIKISKDLDSRDLNIIQQCIHIIIKIINTILINHKTNTGELADTKFFEIFSLFLQSININPNNTYNWGFKLDGYLFIRGYSGEAGCYWNQGNGLYTLCRPW